MRTKIQEITHQLEELKGEKISIIDVTKHTSIMDNLVIVTARSIRHKAAMANALRLAFKHEIDASNITGDNSGWSIVDLKDCVVHIMTSELRDFYQLEQIWT